MLDCAAPNRAGAHSGQQSGGYASRAYDLPPPEIEDWGDHGKDGIEDLAVRQPPERSRSLRAPAEGPAGSVRRSDAGTECLRKAAVPVGRGRAINETVREGLKESVSADSISKLCKWL